MIMAEKANDLGAAKAILESKISSGHALDQLKKLVSNQGGDIDYIDQPETIPLASHQRKILSPTSGFICDIKAKSIGIASMTTGAGRAAKNSEIDLGAGVLLEKKCGDFVRSGEALLTLYSSEPKLLDRAEDIARTAFAFSSEAPKLKPLILEEI